MKFTRQSSSTRIWLSFSYINTDGADRNWMTPTLIVFKFTRPKITFWWVSNKKRMKKWESVRCVALLKIWSLQFFVTTHFATHAGETISSNNSILTIYFVLVCISAIFLPFFPISLYIDISQNYYLFTKNRSA